MVDAQPSVAAEALPEKLSPAQLDDACLTYRHDFGLLDADEKDGTRFEATQWWHAFQYTIIGDAQKSTHPGIVPGWVPIEKMLQWFDEYYPHEEGCTRKKVVRARKSTKCDCYRAEAEAELKALFPQAAAPKEPK